MAAVPDSLRVLSQRSRSKRREACSDILWAVKIDNFNDWDSSGRTEKPAFWLAALLRRTEVLPQANPQYRTNSLRPSISITGGRQNPKKEDICFQQMSSFLVAEAGLEPAASGL